MKSQSVRRDLVLADLRAVLATAGTPALDAGGSRRADHHADYRPAGAQGWTVLNFDGSVAPDVRGDAHRLPFRDGVFRTVVLAETIEHLTSPETAVAEAFRVLAPGGVLVATIPFAFRVHADPDDYQRLTPSGLRRLFAAFDVERIEPQGGPYSVLASVTRDLMLGAKPRLVPGFVAGWIAGTARWATRFDRSPRVLRSAMLSGWTTGYLVVAEKPVL